MNEYTLTFVCENEEKTIETGRRISVCSGRGDVFALYGTLGMGKSTFARAFIQNLCGKNEVPSPTFTLVQMYDAPDFTVYHFDLYRLKTPEEIFELNMEEALYDGVCLIEWPDKMSGYLPRRAIKVEITPSGAGRKLTFTFSDEKTYKRFLPAKE